jgi:4-hydroxybenzoate polyprenyltransferase
MKQIKFFLLLINLLSLDVVLGACAGMYFFSDLLDVNSPFLTYVLLGLAVWGIYTIDHLLDAKFTGRTAISKRHRFHQQYFKTIIIIWLLLILLGLCLLMLFPQIQFIVLPGSVLALVMVFWMGFIRWIGERASWMKEISTAVFYVAGIVLVPVLLAPNEIIDHFFYLFFGAYSVLAWINLLILSFLDREGDRIDGYGSVLVIISKRQLSNLIWILGILLTGLMIILLFWIPSYYKIHCSLLLIMVLFHLLQFSSQKQNNKDSIRQKLEASFILPLILLLL